MIYGNILLTSNWFSISKFSGDRPMGLECDLEKVTSKWWQKKKTRYLRFRFQYYTTYDSLLMLDYLDKCDITKPITISDLVDHDVITRDPKTDIITGIHSSCLTQYFLDRQVESHKMPCIEKHSETYDFSVYNTNVHITAELHGIIRADSAAFGKYIGDDNCSITRILQKRITEHNNNVYRGEAVFVLADTVRRERMHELINHEMQEDDYIELGKLSMAGPVSNHRPVQRGHFLDHVVLAPKQDPAPSE